MKVEKAETVAAGKRAEGGVAAEEASRGVEGATAEGSAAVTSDAAGWVDPVAKRAVRTAVQIR